MKQSYTPKQKRIQPPASASKDQAALAERLGSIEAKTMLEQLRKSYPHPVPSAKEVRAMLDSAMGSRTLTGELHKLRQEEP